MAEKPASPQVDFDVVVVGAGVAGCVAACLLARKGRSVLLAERGPKAGSKNLSGGILYCRVMEGIFPGFLQEAPVERRITRNFLSFLTPSASVALDYADARLAEPVTAVSVLRAKLDEWLAGQCEAAGTVLMPGVKVDALLREGEEIVGIRSGTDELRCHVVIAADGVNSFLCREAGIRREPTPDQLALGVKSVIGLPRKAIEERFRLQGEEGAACAFVGDCTDGVAGGGFLYTNLESLSVGVVLRLDDLVRSGREATDLHDRFLAHPAVAPLLKDGELLEYGSHLVAEGGRAMVRDLVRPGLVVVGDAAGLTLNTGFTVRGMDLAAASAAAAAKAVNAALEEGDFSQTALSAYTAELEKSFVGRDMRTYARAPEFFKNPRVYGDYGRLLGDVLYGVYDLDAAPHKSLVATALAALKKSPLKPVRILRDLYAAARAL